MPLPIGLTDAVELEVKRAVVVRGYRPLLGEAVFATNLVAGGRLELAKGDGGWILVGEDR